MLDYIALNSAFFALCMCCLVYLAIDRFMFGIDTRYFKPGSHREMLLIIAIREYIVLYGPILFCKCEFVIEHEEKAEKRKDKKIYYNVTIRFKHDSTCGLPSEKAIYVVDISSDDGAEKVTVVKPVNDDEIQDQNK